MTYIDRELLIAMAKVVEWQASLRSVGGVHEAKLIEDLREKIKVCEARVTRDDDNHPER